jgi:hypothetical protein
VLEGGAIDESVAVVADFEMDGKIVAGDCV